MDVAVTLALPMPVHVALDLYCHKLSVAHTFYGTDAVRQFENIAGGALQHQYFEARMMVDVDVRRARYLRVVAVLQLHQFLSHGAAMVVDYGQCRNNIAVTGLEL